VTEPEVGGLIDQVTPILAENCCVRPGPSATFPGETVSGGSKLIVAVAGSPLEGVAVTVTVCADVTWLGATYIPVGEIFPLGGVTDHATVAVAVNCCAPEAVRFTLPGLTVTVWPELGTI